ncbi:MAG: nucleotidyltransferase domain-containing protein [Rhodospirillales bacterium]|nr:nucleotidyltransferase domain-containing protein [Rhodospirillales bacterium]
MNEQQTASREIIDDIVRRIVGAVAPEKIILFGSAARGEMSADSDLDILVVKDDPDTLGLLGRIYRSLYGAGAAVDAIVTTPKDLERFRDSHALVFKSAILEGRVLYDAF